jgi:hypothetical protein
VVVVDGEMQAGTGQSTKSSLPDVVSLQTLQTWPVSMFVAPTHDAPPGGGVQELELIDPSAA